MGYSCRPVPCNPLLSSISHPLFLSLFRPLPPILYRRVGERACVHEVKFSSLSLFLSRFVIPPCFYGGANLKLPHARAYLWCAHPYTRDSSFIYSARALFSLFSLSWDSRRLQSLYMKRERGREREGEASEHSSSREKTRGRKRDSCELKLVHAIGQRWLGVMDRRRGSASALVLGGYAVKGRDLYEKF